MKNWITGKDSAPLFETESARKERQDEEKADGGFMGFNQSGCTCGTAHPKGEECPNKKKKWNEF